MFCAEKNPIQTPIDSLVEELNSFCVDTESFDEESLKAYRLQLVRIKNLAGGLMAETSTKEHNYNTEEVKEYIKQILLDGYNLKATELSANPRMLEAQKLKRFEALIKECVEDSSSPFCAKNFKVEHLEGLRKNIVASKTLHELRQAVKLMIAPLSYYQEQKLWLDEIDMLNDEIDSLTKIAEERKRVIDEIVGAYDADCQDMQTLKLCEQAKAKHKLSDEEAAKVGGISRKKLLRLRKDIQLNDFNAEDDLCNLF